jgi:hypothetical protein
LTTVLMDRMRLRACDFIVGGSKACCWTLATPHPTARENKIRITWAGSGNSMRISKKIEEKSFNPVTQFHSAFILRMNHFFNNLQATEASKRLRCFCFT